MFWLLVIFSICIGILISVVIGLCIKKRSWIATLKEYEIECPFEFEWKFTKADLILTSRNSDDGYMQGKCCFAFNIPGLQCHLRIYPNGNNVDRRGQTVIFLYVNGTMERKIAAEFKFSIESANYLSESVNKVYENKYEASGANICKIGKFFNRKNKFFIDEEITVKVKGILKAPRPTVSKISSPISLKWKIKEDDLKEAMKPESDGRILSKEFSIPSFNGIQFWYVMENKLDDKNRAETYFFLYVGFGNYEKIEAVFDICIDSVDYRHVFEHAYVRFSGCGIPLCLTEDLFNPSKRYIVDGYLTIHLTGVFMVKRNRRMTMKCKNGLPQIQGPKDFTIVVGDTEIPVHKQRLMDVSLVWAGMKENVENKMVITDFPLKVIKAAIKVFYNQNCFCSLSIEEIFLLHKFAGKYFIESVLKLAELALIKMISPSNVCLLDKLSASESYNIPKVNESCVKFLNKCFLQTIPIYAAESLDEKFLASVFLRGLHPMTDIIMVERNLRMTMKCKNGLPQIHDSKDFVIVIGDKEIPVHKQRLMDVSPVWAGMAGSGMKESVENKIVIEDFSFKVVAAAIKVFYNENGFCSLTVEEIFSLYRFGDKYFIEFLLELVERSLIKMISASNVCQLVKLSAPNSFNIQKLHESCIKFLTKCFKESIPVYGAESLGDKFLASIFLRSLCPVSDSVTHM